MVALLVLAGLPAYARSTGRSPLTVAALPDSLEIAYDDGGVHTWWCSDKDSFGAAVRFTPREYPCEVIGGRAPIHYDMAAQIYVRVYDAGGPSGHPGTMLAEAFCTGVPHNADSGFKQYNFANPVTIDSGDFYVCFWQKSYFNLVFASDARMDSTSRQWWFLPPQGWVTPYGMDAADQLIRAAVSYPGTGIVEEPALPQSPIRIPQFALSPNPCRGELSLRLTANSFQPSSVTIRDASGRLVRKFALGACAWADFDLRALPDGLYFLQLGGAGTSSTRKLVLQR
jgi:hypothetical protein